MKKPTIKSVVQEYSAEGYDLYEVIDYISKIAKKDFYDYYESGKHFGKWCDSKGYGKVDPENKPRNSSQIWYKEYTEDKMGAQASPEYLDIIGWFIDKFMPETKLETFELSKDDMNESEPDYVKHFLTLLFDKFGDEVALVYDLDN